MDVARYRVESRPEGPVGRLDVLRPDLAPEDLRPALAARLEGLRGIPGRHEATGVVWFAGDVVVDGEDVALRAFGFGPHPAPEHWPRLPLPALLDAAATELRNS